MSGLAAEVAFFGILSVFPALLAFAAALGWLDAVVGGDVADRAQRQVINFLEDVLTDEAGGAIEVVSDLFERENPGVFTFSVLVLAWSMSRGFAAILRALDQAYNVEQPRSQVVQRFRAVGFALLTVVVGAVMVVLLILGPLFGTGHEIAERIGLGTVFATLWNLARIPLLFVVLTGWATLVLHLGPSRRTPWRWDVPGALLTTVLWLAFSAGLRLYVEVAGPGNEMFSTLGGALIVMIWLYLLALALLLGGELNAVLARRREGGDRAATR